MSSLPPYNNDNPYMSPTQQYATQPEYYTSDPYSTPTDLYSSGQRYEQQYVYQTPAYVPQAQYIAVPVASPADEPGANAALAGMILGIAGLVVPSIGILPLLSLIFSIIGLRSFSRKGMAIAGLVMSIIGFVLTVLLSILIITLFIAAASAASSSTY